MESHPSTSASMHERPAELLQHLIRFDTTNPPGNEEACIRYIAELLNGNGIETTLLTKAPGRPNLIARLKGAGSAAPLMLYAHADVVTTAGQVWDHPPFEARIVDDHIWGRGSLDCKHAIAMYLAALLRIKNEGIHPAGDIIFVVTVDEEVGSEMGAKYLVKQHAHLFDGVRYALSEFGGASLTQSGKRFYPIQVAEKQTCPVKITFRGVGGHGAVPIRGGAMAKLARALGLLDRHTLPVHITSETRMMVEGFARGLGGINGFAMRQMLNPPMTNGILKAIGSTADVFSPLFHNSVSPTMLKASEKHNVIPTEVTLGLDGRILPGFSTADLEKELVALLGSDLEIEMLQSAVHASALNMGMFPLLAHSLQELDEQAIPLPFMNFACTDARFFNQLGIQTYGFTPLLLESGLSLTGSIHTTNERVPVKALEFGTQAVLTVLKEFH